MRIIKSNLPENPTMNTLYALFEDESRESLKKFAGYTIEVDTYAIYIDENAKGEEVRLLSIMDVHGRVAVTNSPSAIRGFERIVTLCEMSAGEIGTIEIVKGESKGSREYLTIRLPLSSYEPA